MAFILRAAAQKQLLATPGLIFGKTHHMGTTRLSSLTSSWLRQLFTVGYAPSRNIKKPAPRLIIDSEDTIKAGWFIPGSVFNIELNRNGLIITWTSDEVEIQQLLLEVEACPSIGAVRVRENQ